MWRCRCGETNLKTATVCRECGGARVSSEEKEVPHAADDIRRRTRHVEFNLFGLGRGEDSETPEADGRLMTESELSGHYARARRRAVLSWVLYILAAIVVLGLLVFQIVRPVR